SHLGFTVNRAAIANEYVKRVYGENTGFTMYGGVVMNKVIGGVNPEAVEKGLKLGAKEIWLPTQSAKRHLEKMGQNPADGIELVRDGKVIPELMDVFKLVKDYDVALGTAHVSPEEAFTVVEAARDAGVKKIIITHPEWWVCDYSIEDQIRLVKDYDVILERCYAQNMGKGQPYHLNLKENAELIKEVGYEHVMVDTDGGQVENPDWEIEMYEYMHYLVEYGIPIEHVYHMTKTIPYRLLGIEE
ncbi:MAG: SDR family oxidoreductase, partial [Oribacterium sp.]|nr:SDR family oxidoreductase [Oribacterium sp.]